MSYLIATNLNQEFGSLKINASLKCEQGTMTCIVGPSGSGKSTLLRLLSGLLPPKTSDQKIVLDNVDISNLPSNKRNIGMVFQSYNLFDHLSVQDNVAYGLISNGIPKKQARKMASDFLSQFELKGFEKRYPETLSGGESQRVALARTLIVKPKLVLFDEPLSALDAPLRKKLGLLIKELQKSFGFTAIMVTHDLAEAKKLADQIILIKKGSIYWSGKAGDFKDELLN
ncbi:MAG: ABC transporter ATP-binding protein [Treponema sp.]|nr:ABC transporter ATP-binding protein [Treponema sp.]